MTNIANVGHLRINSIRKILCSFDKIDFFIRQTKVFAFDKDTIAILRQHWRTTRHTVFVLVFFVV